MKFKNCVFSAILCFFSILLQSQNDVESYWHSMLNNNNKEAYNNFKETNKEYNSLDLLISNEILRNENGFINGSSKDFIEKLMTFDDFEYYLYALWNKTFLFDSYLKTGFHNVNSTAIKNIDISKVNNKTIVYALNYINAVLERDNKNYKGYQLNVNKIPVIKDWQFCGVFENLNKSGLDSSYEPEAYAKNDKNFNANSNGSITWYTPNENYRKEPYQFFTNHSEYGNGVNYAQTFIKLKENKRVQLRIGNSSAFKVWLNDVLVYENTKDVNTDLDAYIVNVNLPKGNNRLLIKNAENNGMAYFIARISDFEGNPIEGLEYSNTYSNYNKTTLEAINPKKVINKTEQFFIDKIQKFPNNFLYKYCLINTYLRNQKYEQANKILNPILKEYSKSSLLRILKTYIHSYEEDFVAVNEVNKNILLDDPDYYYSLVSKIRDFKELSRMSIEDLEEFLEKLKNATDSPILKYIGRFFLEARNENMKALRETMDLIGKVASDRAVVLQRFIPLYDNVFKDQNKTISEYEKVLKIKFSPVLLNGLSRYYSKLNRKDDVINLHKENVESFPSENQFLFSLIIKLHNYKKYKESIKYIDKVLENYPYSFKAMEYMGNAFLQLGDKKKATHYYEKSLVYNNGNTKLLKKLETLTRKANLINDYVEQDIYKYVEKERNKNTNNNYGTNILLDNRAIQLYNNGSSKNRTIYLYEITSETGIENYKEYNLGLSGNYTILKSEIIKKNKSITPAEKTGSKFVFNGLEIGDVIYIAYETLSTGSGRFYKDFVDTYQFDSESFCLKTKYTLIIPKDTYFNYKVENGTLEHEKFKKDDYEVHNWELLNATELPKSEDYMPQSNDFARFLHISTIKTWSEIAYWYSDLVRSQSVFNLEVDQKFNEIFPEKDIKKLSEEERAKRIYYYIMNNFNYSFVTFKQSGFIPQKPAKTITSKLGDCKDFSTLFATFARRAGLDANLVLVLTSDYGKKALVLPSQDFNHCIVKVKINGEDQFLELTDKALPFKSVSNNLLNATCLEIPYRTDTKEEYNLFHLTDMKGVSSKMISDVVIKVNEDKTQNITIKSKITGSLASGYFTIFNQDNFELVKKDVLDDFTSRIGDGLVLDTIKNINASKGKEYLTYEASFKLSNKMNDMGSMTFFKLPLVSHAYNPSIISFEKRNYPIIYQNYENANLYKTTYQVEIPKGKKIIEIPEDKKFTYKKHSYEITFKAVNETTLAINFIANTDLSIINEKEYIEFKKYVENILKAKDILIGFK